ALDVHPDALVQPRGARETVRVHVEADAGDTAPPELSERPQEQRLREPAAAPIAAHADDPDVAAAVPLGVVPDGGGDLAASSDDEPQALVVVAAELPPLVEWRPVPLPVVAERVFQRVVECSCVLLAEQVEDEALGHDGLGRRGGEL